MTEESRNVDPIFTFGIDGEPVIQITQDSFYYRGDKVEDTQMVYRRFAEIMKHHEEEGGLKLEVKQTGPMDLNQKESTQLLSDIGKIVDRLASPLIKEGVTLPPARQGNIAQMFFYVMDLIEVYEGFMAEKYSRHIN